MLTASYFLNFREEIPEEEPIAADELQPLTLDEIRSKAGRTIKKKELTRIKPSRDGKSGNGNENQQENSGANKDKQK